MRGRGRAGVGANLAQGVEEKLLPGADAGSRDERRGCGARERRTGRGAVDQWWSRLAVARASRRPPPSRPGYEPWSKRPARQRWRRNVQNVYSGQIGRAFRPKSATPAGRPGVRGWGRWCRDYSGRAGAFRQRRRTSWAKPTSPPPQLRRSESRGLQGLLARRRHCIFPALGAHIAGFALRAFVDYLRRQTAHGQHHHGVSRGVGAEPIAALAAGGRALRARPAELAVASVASEGEPRGGAGTHALNRHRFIPQRRSSPVPDDAWRGP